MGAITSRRIQRPRDEADRTRAATALVRELDWPEALAQSVTDEATEHEIDELLTTCRWAKRPCIAVARWGYLVRQRMANTTDARRAAVDRACEDTANFPVAHHYDSAEFAKE